MTKRNRIQEPRPFLALRIAVDVVGDAVGLNELAAESQRRENSRTPIRRMATAKLRHACRGISRRPECFVPMAFRRDVVPLLAVHASPPRFSRSAMVVP